MAQNPGELGVYQQIERAGRVCYKSENNTTEDSAKPFVERMIQSEHFAMLGMAPSISSATMANSSLHPQQVLPLQHHRRQGLHHHQSPCIGREQGNGRPEVYQRLRRGKARAPHHCALHNPDCHHPRVQPPSRQFDGRAEHPLLQLLKEQVRQRDYHQPPYLGRGSRVRRFSGLSDYRLEDMCADIAEGRAQEWSKLDTWIFANQAAEYAYMKLIEAGCKPQEARAILPLDCNTELVHTAFISDWKHFFDLRAL